MTKLEELKCILRAIKTVRENWISKIENVMRAREDGRRTEKELLTHAIGSPEVLETHANLILLYGILGAEAEAFHDSLEEVPANVKLLPVAPKKVAA